MSRSPFSVEGKVGGGEENYICEQLCYSVVSIICAKVCTSMGGREAYSPLGYPGKLAEEVPLTWTLREPPGQGGRGGQVVSIRTLTGLKERDMCGEQGTITRR